MPAVSHIKVVIHLSRAFWYMRRWQDLENPPQRHFSQLVSDWLHDASWASRDAHHINVNVVAQVVASPFRWGILFNASGISNVAVEQDLGIRLHELFDH